MRGLAKDKRIGYTLDTLARVRGGSNNFDGTNARLRTAILARGNGAPGVFAAWSRSIMLPEMPRILRRSGIPLASRRTADALGYIRIAVPGRGEVYEHRVVAEVVLGRGLSRTEVVHHIDEDRMNNEPSNIEVLRSNHHHRAIHRKPVDSRGRRLQFPWEPNAIIECACGCGSQLLRYDSEHRPRRCLHGHCLRTTGPGRPKRKVSNNSVRLLQF